VFGTEIAARAGPILDVDGAIQICSELLCQLARDDITAAPGRVRNYELDWPRRPLLRQGTTRSRDKSAQSDREGAHAAQRRFYGRMSPDLTVHAHRPLPPPASS